MVVPVSAMRLAADFGHHRQTENIGCLALIGRHAKGCIAFQMLDRAKTFLM